MEYGLAIDIGTTNIKFEKICMKSGEVTGKYQQKNSQRQYGGDVLSRIHHACHGKKNALQELVRQDILSGMQALQAEKPKAIAIACNTTMMALLCGDDLTGMQDYPFTPQRLVIPKREDILMAPAAGAFLGGDVVAGISVLPEETESYFFIDLGTNGEIVLKTGDCLLAASAAAGPAFEYMADAEGSMLLEALRGACESGAVDATGLLSEEWFDGGYLWKSKENNRDFLLTQQKIRDLQLAKAAIQTGIEFLMEQYKKQTGKTFVPENIYLAGGMGVVSEEACLSIGMLPEAFRGKCAFLGNTALQGAKKLLLHPESFEELQMLAKKIQVHNLAAWENFNERFIENINFPVKEQKRRRL